MHRNRQDRGRIPAEFDNCLGQRDCEVVPDAGSELSHQHGPAFRAALAVPDAIVGCDLPGRAAVLKKNLNRLSNVALLRRIVFLSDFGIFPHFHLCPKRIDPWTAIAYRPTAADAADQGFESRNRRPVVRPVSLSHQTDCGRERTCRRSRSNSGRRPQRRNDRPARFEGSDQTGPSGLHRIGLVQSAGYLCLHQLQIDLSGRGSFFGRTSIHRAGRCPANIDSMPRSSDHRLLRVMTSRSMCLNIRK
jgi:hypothetical protein